MLSFYQFNLILEYYSQNGLIASFYQKLMPALKRAALLVKDALEIPRQSRSVLPFATRQQQWQKPIRLVAHTIYENTVGADNNLDRFDSLWLNEGSGFLHWTDQEHGFTRIQNQVPKNAQGKHGRAYFSEDQKKVCKLTARDDEAKVSSILIKHRNEVPISHEDIVYVSDAQGYAIMQMFVDTSSIEEDLEWAIDIVADYFGKWLGGGFTSDGNKATFDDMFDDDQMDLAFDDEPRAATSINTVMARAKQQHLGVLTRSLKNKGAAFHTKNAANFGYANKNMTPYIGVLMEVVLKVVDLSGILLKDLHKGNIGKNPVTGNLMFFDLGFNLDTMTKKSPQIRTV